MTTSFTNFRAVLGDPFWTARTGIYRSNTPDDGENLELPAVFSQIVSVIDLRTPSEVSANQHPLGNSAAYVNAPLHASSSARPPLDQYDLLTLYRFWLDSGKDELYEILAAVATAELPLLICCSAGKDRTGIVVALLSRLWGEDDEAIGADYRLSGEAMRERFDNEMRHSQNREQTKRMISSDPTDLLSVIHELEYEHSSIAHYFNHLGLSSDQITRLQQHSSL